MTYRFPCLAVMIGAFLARSPSTAPAIASDGVLDADQAAALRVAWRASGPISAATRSSGAPSDAVCPERSPQ